MIEQVKNVVAIDAPHTLVRREPYEKSHVGVVLPGLFNVVGDVCHLIALTAEDADTILVYTDSEYNTSRAVVNAAMRPAMDVKRGLNSPNGLMVLFDGE